MIPVPPPLLTAEPLRSSLLAALDQHAIVSVADVQGRIVYVNRLFCEISGYGPEELVGANHRLLKSGLHDAAFYEAMWSCISSGRTWRGEVCNRRKTGELYWVDATITPELDANGLPCRYVSIRTDITATRNALQRAERAEERFGRSQTFSNIGSWEYDLRSGALHWSERVGPLFGLPAGTPAPTLDALLAAVHADDRAGLVEAIDTSVRTGTPYEVEHRCVWPDGSVHWLLARGDVERDAGGTPLRMLGVAQDITPRKEAQAQLDLFRQAVDAAREGIAVCSAATEKLCYLNPAAQEILGLKEGEAGGVSPIDLIPEPSRPQFIEAYERALAGQPAQVEFDALRSDGSEVPLRNALAPVRDATGTVTHLVNVFGDRTSEIRRQRELQAALDDAQRANRAKAEFMSRMSHELRTPLNAILGFSQVLLLRHELAPGHADSVAEILKAGKHLLELIDEVLDIARIDLGTLRVALEPVQLGDVVTRASALVDATAREHGVAIDVDLDGTLSVVADPLRLKQCVINLLSNAVKYNRRGGAVRVRARALADGRVRLEVQDDGDGIGAEDLGRIFQPFTRLDRHVDRSDGVGIGLSITRRLVELMKGEIGARSEAGCGSEFWIALPAAPTTGAATSAGASAFGTLDLCAPTRHERVTRRVLYVEDNPANLKLVRSMLRLLPDVAVITATTAAEGMALARSQRPDLILLDIGLPGMSGIELLACLRREPSLADKPIYAVSANAMPADVARGLGVGFDDYLTKPIDVHKLLSRVQAGLALEGGVQ